MLLSFLLAATVTSASAVTIAQWTFEANTPADLANSTASPSVAADLGSGSASGFHASAVTDWSTPAGNGSANSFSANTWAVGDYWQFQVSTMGHQDIAVTWHQTRSSTGPATWDLAYSLDGVAFTVALDNYNVNANPWLSGSTDAGSILPSLSLPASLGNAATVYFRIIADSSPTGTNPGGGTARVDNFTVSGTPILPAVPDTGATALLLCITLLGLLALHRFAGQNGLVPVREFAFAPVRVD